MTGAEAAGYVINAMVAGVLVGVAVVMLSYLR